MFAFFILYIYIFNKDEKQKKNKKNNKIYFAFCVV